MTRFKGFVSKEDAEKYQSEHGGYLCGAESKKRTDRRNYDMAVVFGNLNADKYPWCLQWYER